MKASASTVAVVLISALAWANWPTEDIDGGVEVDVVIVKKSERVLELYARDTVVRSYSVSLGGDPVGPKRVEGDERTPEGTYTIDYRKSDSSFHRALHISYPSAADTAQARANGVDPGGQIMVHGLPNGLGFLGRLHRLANWTDGCVAVTNAEIEQIWNIVRDGPPIRIEP